MNGGGFPNGNGGFDLGYSANRYTPWKAENVMNKEDGWDTIGDGKFDNRILNPNVEDPDKPDDDYNGTLESHMRPFLTAMAISATIVAIAVITTPLPALRHLFF